MEKTLVLLHGWQRSKDDWNLISEALSKDIEVVSWDLPGFGSEPLISDDWSVIDYSNWINNKIREELEGKQIILLGHSFGGRISSYLASLKPDYLKALILYASPSIYRPKSRIKLKIFLYKILKKIIPQKLLQSFKSDDQKNVENTPLSKIFRKVISFDQTEYLGNICVPTYIVQGDKDQSVDVSIANEMETLIPNSKMIILSNASHFVHLENPTLFNAIIKNIISEVLKND